MIRHVRAYARVVGTGEDARAVVESGDYAGMEWGLYNPPRRDRDGERVTLSFHPPDQFARIVGGRP